MKTQNKPDIYEKVTNCIIEQLEKGVIPWQSPHFAKVGFPENFQSGNHYQGINILLLGMCGYTSPHFLTYKQAQNMGGQVRKGEKGHLIVKYGEYTKASKSGDDDETLRYLRGFTVFNASQIDGIEFPMQNTPEFTPSQKTNKARKIVENMKKPPTISEGEKVRTCYSPKEDKIEIPHRAYFSSEERFYKSLFHELIHSTGAAHRLARKTLLENKGMFTSDKTIYSKEELVAEIGAAFLCAHAGIVMDEHENSASYLKSWLDVIKVKDNRKWIVQAAAQAQKAVRHILETSS